MGTRLYVGNLSFQSSTESVRAAFSQMLAKVLDQRDLLVEIARKHVDGAVRRLGGSRRLEQRR